MLRLTSPRVRYRSSRTRGTQTVYERGSFANFKMSDWGAGISFSTHIGACWDTFVGQRLVTPSSHSSSALFQQVGATSPSLHEHHAYAPPLPHSSQKMPISHSPSAVLRKTTIFHNGVSHEFNNSVFIPDALGLEDDSQGIPLTWL